jgi:capsule polysaccharide modification protein KpsS
MFDTPAWARNFSELIRMISQSLPVGHKLVVKQHPKQRSGISLNQTDKIVFIDKQFDDKTNKELNFYLMRNMQAMISINSSFILESLVHKKPVISLGYGIFTGHGITREEYSMISDKTFKNLKVTEETNLYKFLHELIFYRQVCDYTDNNAYDRLWSRFLEEYSKIWR